MAMYQQKHLEIPQIPIAVLAIDITGHLPVTLKGNRWALTAIYLHTLYVFVVPMQEKSAEMLSRYTSSQRWKCSNPH